MKKVFLSLLVLSSLTLSSCGDKKEEDKKEENKKMSACDCKKAGFELAAKAAKDPSKAAEYTKEAEALTIDCKDFKEEDYKDCK